MSEPRNSNRPIRREPLLEQFFARRPESGGAGSGAPANATYIVVSANGTLTDERILTAGTLISVADAGAGSTITVGLADLAGVSVIGRSANSSGPPAAIVAGSNGRYLQRQSDIVGFSDLKAKDLSGTRIRAYMASNLALTASTWHTMQFDTEDEDSGAEFNTSTYTFTPAETGIYLIAVQTAVSGTSGGVAFAIWEGTTTEVRRLSDYTGDYGGGATVIQLLALQGYTFRIRSLTSSRSAVGGSAFNSLTIRRLY